jgi:DmsE family decaheme c-type cytochrome
MHNKNILVFVFLFTFLLTSASLSLSDDKGQDMAKNYAGSAACKGCHEDLYMNYAGSVHSKKHVEGPIYKEACETCHGSGAAHVEKGGGKGVSIFNFGKKNDAETRTSKCLSCHEDSRHLAFWNMSEHKNADVACNDCHKIHPSGENNLKAEQATLCFGCHRDIKARANRQSHHPIKEGKISCTDCHNPHGSFGTKMVKADSVNELCYKCHAEKRGPFRLEHQPVAENCLNCHNSHGSNHRAMLVSKPPQLCQECHGDGGHPGRPYTDPRSFKGPDPRVQMYGRACMNCHTNIHGSSADDLFLR